MNKQLDMWEPETLSFPLTSWTRRYRITHEGDIIGYCFARDAESAINAFRAAHNIPGEITLVANL